MAKDVGGPCEGHRTTWKFGEVPSGDEVVARMGWGSRWRRRGESWAAWGARLRSQTLRWAQWGL